MDKAKAAKRLGVSTRTLERLMVAGRIKKGRVVRDGRPLVDFAESDVERLKAELDADKESSTVSLPAEAKLHDGVSFRLDALSMERLREEAKRRGRSPNDLARSLVVRSLEAGTVDHHAKEVRALREALADTWHAFLVMKCGESKEQAQEFVDRTILLDG